MAPRHVEKFSKSKRAPYSGQASGYRLFNDAQAERGIQNANSVDWQMQHSAKKLGELEEWDNHLPDLPMERGINALEWMVTTKDSVEQDVGAGTKAVGDIVSSLNPFE